jgi:hypothetical protein
MKNVLSVKFGIKKSIGLLSAIIIGLVLFSLRPDGQVKGGHSDLPSAQALDEHRNVKSHESGEIEADNENADLNDITCGNLEWEYSRQVSSQSVLDQFFSKNEQGNLERSRIWNNQFFTDRLGREIVFRWTEKQKLTVFVKDEEGFPFPLDHEDSQYDHQVKALKVDLANADLTQFERAYQIQDRKGQKSLFLVEDERGVLRFEMIEGSDYLVCEEDKCSCLSR